MELSQLRAFVTVSRTGTIAAAAECLNVTSSPLSRTIRELERHLGRELFLRRYHRFERTPFAEEFLPLAVEILAQADEAERFAAGEEAPLRIGATPWTSKRLTRQLMESAAERSAGTPEFSSDVSSVLIESLRHGELDLALVHLPVTARGVATAGLARYRYSVAAAGDPDLPTGRPLRLSDLRGRKLLSFPLAMQPAPMKAMLDALTRAGVESIAEIDLRDVIGLEGRMARTGELMLAMLSDDLPTARFLDLDRLRTYPVADGEIRFEIGLAWRGRDCVHRAAIDAVVAALSPDGDDLPLLG
ncbi:LysR family transcriptional regulator [Amycolatopsis thermophila]|uniref:DNA-binding transcriptional LysR family regulator n=1 Tax=Amycolatopsis thermophila TaxID=206084 RepID=A0ABU0F5A5_9PSEU|nr:LysR family transcriptional regulator [Amycolatopsis thermophila]MDQ0382770.1 DNA-binding transcriptional LysR family regulator [Amycolatopsis thermophila]